MSFSSFGTSVVDSGTKAGDAPLIPTSLFRRVYSFHEIIDCAAAGEFLNPVGNSFGLCKMEGFVFGPTDPRSQVVSTFRPQEHDIGQAHQRRYASTLRLAFACYIPQAHNDVIAAEGNWADASFAFITRVLQGIDSSETQFAP